MSCSWKRVTESGSRDSLKVAIIHEWLISFAGSERVLEQIVSLYPEADLFCLVDFMKSRDRQFIKDKDVKTSFIQHLPRAKKLYRNYLPLMPFAVQRFELSKYDLILSSSHAVAKGVRKSSNQIHVCYCHTPMRYAWDLKEQYLKESGLDKGVKGFMARQLLDRLQKWDYETAQHVDYFIANSHYIADRIRRAYGRESIVIYPPVDVEHYSLSLKKDNYYVTASRMVPYKKMDVIVESFARMPDRNLIVIGDGPDYERVRSLAASNVKMLGYQSSEALRVYLQSAKAFIFAAEEDFGIMPVEAQACGTPVIAYGRGGARETVLPLKTSMIDGDDDRTYLPTGVLFDEQTAESIVGAVRIFEENVVRFDRGAIRQHAMQFSPARFRREFRSFVDVKLADHRPVA